MPDPLTPPTVSYDAEGRECYDGGDPAGSTAHVVVPATHDTAAGTAAAPLAEQPDPQVLAPTGTPLSSGLPGQAAA